MLLKGVIAARCCGVCPSSRPSVTFVDSVENSIFKFFSLSGSHTTLVFFHSKRHGNTPTGTSNAGGVGRNCNFEPISGFIACCQRCDGLGVINTVPPDRSKLWHLSLW